MFAIPILFVGTSVRLGSNAALEWWMELLEGSRPLPCVQSPPAFLGLGNNFQVTRGFSEEAGLSPLLFLTAVASILCGSQPSWCCRRPAEA